MVYKEVKSIYKVATVYSAKYDNILLAKLYTCMHAHMCTYNTHTQYTHNKKIMQDISS